MRIVVLSGWLVLGLSGAALGADLPTMPAKTPAMAVLAYDWTGLYAGINYGSALAQSDAHHSSALVYRGADDIGRAGFTGGIQAGYNWQVNPNWLLGVEADFGYLAAKRSFADFNDPSVQLGVRPSWYGTVRGRAGYVAGPSLFYLTAGAAFVEVKQTFGSAAASPISHSGVETGWAAGGGIETKLSRNWSATTEYLYIDAGSRNFASVLYGNPDTVTVNSRFHVLKSGISYKFGGAPEPLPFFDSPMLNPVRDWAGFYAGVNLGGGVSSTATALRIDAIPSGEVDLNGGGFAGGVQAGYNVMLGSGWLMGVEADIGYLGISHALAPWNDANMRLSQKTDWYGTVRGRVGRSTGPALLYLTAGAAFANVQTGFALAGAGANAGTERAAGWTFGGGTEVALDARWSAKLESLYMDLGRDTRALSDGVDLYEVSFRRRFTVVRAGLNYRFGGDDAVSARY